MRDIETLIVDFRLEEGASLGTLVSVSMAPQSSSSTVQCRNQSSSSDTTGVAAKARTRSGSGEGGEQMQEEEREEGGYSNKKDLGRESVCKQSPTDPDVSVRGAFPLRRGTVHRPPRKLRYPKLVH